MKRTRAHRFTPFTLFFFTVLVALAHSFVIAQKIEKTKIRSQDKDRTYYLCVPDNLDPAKPVPLIVLLHGSGRSGISLVEKWNGLAKKEGFIIVGPDAKNSETWNIPEDGPNFIHDLVEALTARYPINKRRIYLFGHSGGAGFALNLSLLESEYFAATAIHAGALRREAAPFIEQARRKIPISIFVGTNDSFFPLPVVRATRDALNERGFKVELTEIKDHTHFYYDLADKINLQAWDFLKKHELEADPEFQLYEWKKK